MKNSGLGKIKKNDLVWYVSYGSNLHHDRFIHYIRGGKFKHSLKTLPGCTDRSLPRDKRAVVLPYQLYFGDYSASWEGAVAFIDPERSGRTLAYAYLITAIQFWQIVVQESANQIGSVTQLSPEDLPSGPEGISGDGKYDKMVDCGELDGHPMYTFTSPKAHARYARPTPAYLQTVGLGIHQTHDLNDLEIAAYLTVQPGVKGNYREEFIRDLMFAASPTYVPAEEYGSLQPFPLAA